MTPLEIKTLRKATKLSQEGFAELLGCGRSTINQWEMGTRRPRGTLLNRLSKLKQCQADCRCFCHYGFVRKFKQSYWSPAEVNMLKEMVEQHATIGEMRKELREAHGIERSKHSIKRKMDFMGLFYNPEEDLSTTAAARYLGVDRQTVLRRIGQGFISANRKVGNDGTVTKAWRITRDEIHRLQRDMVGLS